MRFIPKLFILKEKDGHLTTSGYLIIIAADLEAAWTNVEEYFFKIPHISMNNVNVRNLFEVFASS